MRSVWTEIVWRFMFSTSPGPLETVLRTRASGSVIMMSGYFMRGDNTEKVWKYFSFFSCGPLKTPRDIDIGCVRTHGDPDSSYPFCCPQIVCQWYMWQVQYIFLINYSSSSVWRNSSIKMKVGRGRLVWYPDILMLTCPGCCSLLVRMRELVTGITRV